MKLDFALRLIQWATLNNRPMPWKGEKDPYKIWLSEIILQQTRVDQGWAYYEKFIRIFPTVQELAEASDKQIFKCWEGLGYYSRCKHLIQTARKITSQFGGQFPVSYLEIMALSGIGPYTAAAIASFAFNLPHAVVDGNVQRVLSRFFGISLTAQSAMGKRIYADLATSLLDQEQPGIYNQAIMDFGAVICKPKQPLCQQCVQHTDCAAWNHHWVEQLPAKAKKNQKKDRWFTYFIVQSNRDEIFIRQRKGKDIWQNLYEFVLLENDGPCTTDKLLSSDFVRDYFVKSAFTLGPVSKVYKQQLTHQTIHGRFIQISVQPPYSMPEDYQLVKKKNIRNFAFPKLITGYWQDPSTGPLVF